MKVLKFWGATLMSALLCMNFASCNNEENVIPDEPQDEKYITVGLDCTGEFLEVLNSPMSRTSGEELYAIQVHSLTEKDTYYDQTPYAYGLFTSLEDVTIKLLQGRKYWFEVSIVIDPFKSDDDFWFSTHYGDYYSEHGTEFIYSTSDELWLLSVGKYDYDRYYGRIEEYTATENSSVEIQTKRVAYGVRYETSGLGDGESITVDVTRGVSNRYTVELGTTVYEGIYTFADIYGSWIGNRILNETTGQDEYENYTSEKTLTLSWNKADGDVVPMGTYAVTFKRNVKTTIKIKAEYMNMANGIKVFKEEASIVDDENYYDIQGGTVTEVQISSGN